ncbi:MAG: lecithin retinol acyltransferase family protein [Treponema sp.]|nr:lecithin retinol acyltransferase family protein [Treponema sp.]
MKKKILIAAGIAFLVFILAFLILYIFFPVSIINGEVYNTNKLHKLNKQRELAYNELFVSLHNGINKIFNNIYMERIENGQFNADIKIALDTFYGKAASIDEIYYNLMPGCKSNFLFILRNRKTRLLKDVFPAYIDTIEYNNQLYNQFALNLFMDQYENIVKRLINEKTNDIMEFISVFPYYSGNEMAAASEFTDYNYDKITGNLFDSYVKQCEIYSTTGKINVSYGNFSDDSVFNIPTVKIDNDYYCLTAVNELHDSMEIISSFLINYAKNILIKGVNYQTEIYSANIDSYANWYYSYAASIGKTITNIIGFFKGDKLSEEKFYTDNFNRIMNKNADFNNFIESDMNNLEDIIVSVFYEYLELKNYFSVNNFAVSSGAVTTGDYIGVYTENIFVYFENVYEALHNANNYYIQEFTISDNDIVKKAKYSAKLLSDISFFGGIFIDYISLKTQELLNKSELRQQIFDSMIKNQENKIKIINDPFNYLFDKLSAGSVLFVDNYFLGLNTYQHYGVYIGNGKVIHFAPYEGQEISMENGVIHETTLEVFLNGRAMQIDQGAGKRFSEYEIIQRARSRIGEKGYNLLTNNCEHFARWCVTGESVSYQVVNLPDKMENTFLSLKDNYDMISKFLQLFN